MLLYSEYLRRKIPSCFLKLCPGLGVLPLGVKVERKVAVANAGVDGIVRENQAADLQPALVQRLRRAMLQLAVEISRRVVVALRCSRMFVGEQSSSDFKRLLEQPLKRGM